MPLTRRHLERLFGVLLGLGALVLILFNVWYESLGPEHDHEHVELIALKEEGGISSATLSPTGAPGTYNWESPPYEAQLAHPPYPSPLKSWIEGIERNYLQELAEAIRLNQRYPTEARVRHEEGVVNVYFVINWDGRILYRQIEKSSGHALLDQAALQALDARPVYRPIPHELKRRYWPLKISLEFSLR